jgi:hypothetical protein
MNRVIEVNVSLTGEVTVQTKGYAGSDCLQASKFVELGLGLILNDTKTAEFYQTATASQHLQQQ